MANQVPINISSLSLAIQMFFQQIAHETLNTNRSDSLAKSPTIVVDWFVGFQRYIVFHHFLPSIYR